MQIIHDNRGKIKLSAHEAILLTARTSYLHFHSSDMMLKNGTDFASIIRRENLKKCADKTR